MEMNLFNNLFSCEKVEQLSLFSGNETDYGDMGFICHGVKILKSYGPVKKDALFGRCIVNLTKGTIKFIGISYDVESRLNFN